MKKKKHKIIANSLFLGGTGFMLVIMFWIPALDNTWVFFGSMVTGFVGLIWLVFMKTITNL